jgi:hypothetical protein
MGEWEGRLRSFFLDYYIIEKEILIDGFTFHTYGLEIAKRMDSGGACTEFRRVYDVFCTEKEAFEALNTLIRNAVTPVCLLEILEDMIGVGDFVNEESSIPLRMEA